ncbi:MAG: TIGR02206 family membrane protein [Alphaproteobacteria bacterium]|nr:TIGR02206 family membrane protein [Alphaproteobacteria bacterium]
MNASPFILFGNIHIMTMLVILAIAIFLPLIYKSKSETQKSVMTKMIAYIVIAHVVISPYKDLFILENPYNWREVLPFHMCDLSEIFLAWFLLGGPKILYKCAFFWGIGGATMAIITPDISYHDLDYAFFMIGHGMIVVGIMYATVALNNRPYAKDILTVSLITYLMAKPAGASLMDAFPEPPYHLLVLTPLALATFVIIYTPYFIKDRLQK